MRVTKNNLLTDSNKKSRHTGRVSYVYHVIWVFQFLSHSSLKFVQKTNYKKLYEGIRFFKLDRKMANSHIKKFSHDFEDQPLRIVYLFFN